jgi:hypothetical protein
MEGWVILLCFGIFIILSIVVVTNDKKRQADAKIRLSEQLSNANIHYDKVINITSTGIDSKVVFDLNNRKIAIINTNAVKIDYVDFDKIIQCEILEDNSVVMKGGVGRAVVGGILAGGVGAIVGAQTRGSSEIVKNLSIRIITNDVINSLVWIHLIKTATKRDSFEYKRNKDAAQQIYSTIISILNTDPKPVSTLPPNSANAIPTLNTNPRPVSNLPPNSPNAVPTLNPNPRPVINLPPNSPNAFTFTGVADKTKYNVVIKSPGTNVMNVISIIQKLTGLDFNKSMRIAATPGGKVLEGVSKEVANDAKAKLEEAGAEVVLE